MTFKLISLRTLITNIFYSNFIFLIMVIQDHVLFSGFIDIGFIFYHGCPRSCHFMWDFSDIDFIYLFI